MTKEKLTTKQRTIRTLLIILSFFIIFYGVQLWLGLVIGLLGIFGISFASINENILNTIYAFVIYGITLAAFFGLLKVINMNLSKIEAGIQRLPTWSDIFLTPVAMILYLILTFAFSIIFTQSIPGLDTSEPQDTGFGGLNSSIEYIGAFVTLVVLAPVAEELLFRGYLFGALRRYINPILTIVITSVMFSLVHGNVGVMIDTLALGLVLGTLRQMTGSIWASILLHMAKNALAFYLLFINTGFLL